MDHLLILVGNKIKWVSYTGVFAVLAHYNALLVRYIVPSLEVLPANSSGIGGSQFTMLCSFGKTWAPKSHSFAERHGDFFVDSQNEQCQKQPQKVMDGSKVAWYMFAAGGVPWAVGMVSHGTTMVSYMDENVSRTESMLYNCRSSA